MGWGVVTEHAIMNRAPGARGLNDPTALILDQSPSRPSARVAQNLKLALTSSTADTIA